MNKWYKRIIIGLMGVRDDGKTLVYPNGEVFIKVPKKCAILAQRIQHKYALSPNGKHRVIPNETRNI